MKIYTFARVCNESSKAELCVPAWQVEEKMEDVTRPVQSVFSLKEMRWSKPDQEALIGVLQARQIEKKRQMAISHKAVVTLLTESLVVPLNTRAMAFESVLTPGGGFVTKQHLLSIHSGLLK